MNHDEKMQDLKSKIKELREEIKAHADEVDDPKCAALCETSAEVLTGIATAYDHYINRSEKAWEE
jgi:hypothetical protein